MRKVLRRSLVDLTDAKTFPHVERFRQREVTLNSVRIAVETMDEDGFYCT